jgi:hypothetical protein
VHHVHPGDVKHINNTGDAFRDLDPNKRRRVQSHFSSGKRVTTPIVLHNKTTGDKHLLAGNTRLAYNSQINRRSTPAVHIPYHPAPEVKQ